VPWVSPRGAIATQACVNTDLGRQGLALLAQGVPGDVALSALLRKVGEREIRQVHGLDGERAFCHTGASVAAIREPRMYHNLRVGDHADQVAELRRVWAVVVAHTKQIEAEYGAAAVRLFGRVKH